MSTQFPQSQIEDAHKLDADGYVSLIEIHPLGGGSIYAKAGVEYTYLAQLYESLPISLRGEQFESDGSMNTPRLMIGQPDVDLLPFKGLINDGLIEGAQIIRHRVLLEDMLAGIDSKFTSYFRVKRPEAYDSKQVVLLLSTYSGLSRQQYPFRQYLPPAFPWVTL